ncbi:hypothetical protein [Micromonospora rhizosphaerae]|nr:hypothetical protein [Micromonospora rhizosphaerae]
MIAFRLAGGRDDVTAGGERLIGDLGAAGLGKRRHWTTLMAVRLSMIGTW